MKTILKKAPLLAVAGAIAITLTGCATYAGAVEYIEVTPLVAEAPAPESEPETEQEPELETEPELEAEPETVSTFPFVFNTFDTSYRYITSTPEYSYRTVGDIQLSNFRIIEGDDLREAREGWEWRIVDIRMAFGDDFAHWLGFTWAAVYGIDYYAFSLDENVSSSSDGLHTIYWNGNSYEIYQRLELAGDWGDWYFEMLGTFTVHAPIGYDGAVIAFFNGAQLPTEGATVPTSELIDDDTLWFRMK